MVDRKELDQVDEAKRLMIESLRPEPQAVKIRSLPNEQEQTKRNKKTKIRVVDLESENDVEKPSLHFSSVAISIPNSNNMLPSLQLQPPIDGSSPSVKSVDSQDAQQQIAESIKPSSMNMSEMKQMLLDMTEKRSQLEDSKSSLQSQLHAVQMEKHDLQERLKVIEQNNTELMR